MRGFIGNIIRLSKKLRPPAIDVGSLDTFVLQQGQSLLHRLILDLEKDPVTPSKRNRKAIDYYTKLLSVYSKELHKRGEAL